MANKERELPQALDERPAAPRSEYFQKCLGCVLRRAKNDQKNVFMSMEKAIQLLEQVWALESEGKLEEARLVCCEALHLVEMCA